MKGYYFKDKNIRYVELTYGTYDVNGEIVCIESYGSKKVSVDSFDKIRKITKTNVVDYYVCGEDVISVSTYYDETQLLLKNSFLDDEGRVTWNSVDDEYAYKKYVDIHKPVYREILSYGDYYVFDIEESVLDTGNRFVISEFVNGGNNIGLFVYNRPSALIDIVSKTFSELGMTYADKLDYGSTKHSKVWSNSTHSCIRYVVAFGTYVFNDSYSNVNIKRGTLDKMLSEYESDKNEIREIITTKYKVHFGYVDSGSFNFIGLLETLSSVKNSLFKIPSNKNTESDLRFCRSKLVDAIKMIELAHKVE